MNRYIEQHIRFQERAFNRWGRLFLVLTFPILFILFFLFAPAAWCSQRFPIPMGLGAAVGGYVGGLVSASGLALYLWTLVLFAKAHGTQVPVAPTLTVVSTGPYAVSRNPMLTAAIVMVCGAGVAFNSWSFMFGGLVIPIFYIFYIKFVEEVELQARFGEEYLSYRRSTPFILPRIHSRRPPL